MSALSSNAVTQPAHFAFTPETEAQAQAVLAKYPAGRQRSAVMPWLDLAQRQNDNWLPRAAMDYVADRLGIPRVKVYEVASFYTMYNLAPVGRHLVQVCTTTPCWLRGSDGVVDACRRTLGIEPGQMTEDGQFTLVEVECLGACVTAPMMQINDSYFEDLTPENTAQVLEDLKAGRKPQTGSQMGRPGQQALSGPTSLRDKEPDAAPVMGA